MKSEMSEECGTDPLFSSKEENVGLGAFGDP